MKLGSLFGATKTLAKAPKPAPASEPTNVVSSQIKQLIHKPGEFNIKWPKVAPQQVKDYQAITTLNELEAYCKRCQETGLAGYDIETAASENTRTEYAALSPEEQEAKREAYLKTPLDPWKGEVCTFSLAAAPHEARAVFLSHKKGARLFEPQRSRSEARRLALDIVDRLIFRNRMVIKIAWNLSFETKYAAKYAKYILTPVSDPQVSSVRCMQIVLPQKIADPKRPVSGKGLKPQTMAIFGVQMGSFKGLLAKYGVEFFDEISCDEQEALVYSCEDSDYALQQHLYWIEVAKQIPKYEEWLTVYEMPFARVIGLMEYWGMGWDENLARVKGEEAVTMQEQAAERIRKIAMDTFGIEVNTGKSGKTNEIKSLVFDYFKLVPAKWSKKVKGAVSMDEEAIIDMRFMLENKLEDLKEEKYLAVELPEDWESRDPDTDPRLSKDERQAIRIRRREPHPHKDAALQMLDELQNIQRYSTLLSSHIRGREKYLNSESGRIHANYTPWTETARLNSNSPNGQNVPRMDNDDFGIRNFYVPGVGKILYFIDFSGFELRLMAWRSGDEVMIEIFKTGGDIHRRTASVGTGKPEAEITKKERQDAKPANFGIAYGGTEHALQKTFKTEYLIRKTLDECLKLVNAVKGAYKRIPEFQRGIALDAREKGWVQTIYGYIRLLPNINSPNSFERGKDERRAANTPIQGGAADVMKKCQNQVYEEIGRGTALNYDAEALGLTAGELAAHRGEDVPILSHGHTDMIAQIHDEIIFEMDDDTDVVALAGAWVKAMMEQPPLPNFPLPIEAEDSVGYKWGAKQSVKSWLAEKLTA